MTSKASQAPITLVQCYVSGSLGFSENLDSGLEMYQKPCLDTRMFIEVHQNRL